MPILQESLKVVLSKSRQCNDADNLVRFSNLMIYPSKPKTFHFWSPSASGSKPCLTKWGVVPPNKISPFLRNCLPEIGYQAVSPYKCDFEKLKEPNNSRDLLRIDISRWPRNRSSLIFSRILLVAMPLAWDSGGKWTLQPRLIARL